MQIWHPVYDSVSLYSAISVINPKWKAKMKGMHLYIFLSVYFLYIFLFFDNNTEKQTIDSLMKKFAVTIAR